MLERALARELHGALERPGAHEAIVGLENLDEVIEIDQSPIGRTPRSNPATYTKVFDAIRELFANLPESKARGYARGRFSFNVTGGRCEACGGAGVKTVEMQFLADVEVPCDVCGGRRFKPETLEVQYRFKSITDVLAMTIAEALAFFADHKKIKRGLETLDRIGLGYLPLGQPSTTLSGGEAQRVKLASQLQRPPTGNTLYLLDEPTTGLHFLDVRRLVAALQELVDRGQHRRRDRAQPRRRALRRLGPRPRARGRRGRRRGPLVRSARGPRGAPDERDRRDAARARRAARPDSAGGRRSRTRRSRATSCCAARGSTT